MGFNADDFPNAERYYSTAITLPIYPTLSKLKQDEIINILTEALK